MNMNYEEMLRELYSVHPQTKIKLGLDRIKELLERMGNPQNNFEYIHVAGTNGKGTVVKTIGKVLKAHGVNVGTYFSPHLETFRERIRFNDEYISRDEAVEMFEEVMKHAKGMTDDMEPTFFEIVTAMAFLYFKKKNADVVVSEVGLGGRFDATNVVENPLLCVITNVDYDHMDILGSTLSEIAFEKAGIIKEGIPVVLGNILPEALNVINSRAKELGADTIIWGKDYKIANERFELGRNSFDYIGEKRKLHLETRLNGVHAMQDMAVALASLQRLEKEKIFELDEKKTFDAIFTLNMEGRFEWLPSDIIIILDAAHNAPAMKILARNLKRYFPSKKVNAVVGILNDKDYKSMIEELAPAVKKLYITSPVSERATDPFGIYMWATKEYDNIGFVKDVKDAVSMCHDMSKDENAVMLVSGSFYTVGAARTFLTGNLEADGA